MQYQFSLFGFVVKVARVKRYSAAVFVEGPDEPQVWTLMSSSLIKCRFLAWKAAREYASAYSERATYVVWDMDFVNKRLVQRHHRTIVINKSVSFFGR